MKEQEPLHPETPGNGKNRGKESKPITSESVKNAHAAGDGAMERSLDSIPDEEELNKESKGHPRRTEQY